MLSLRRIGLSWLMWLALLLPVAQAAAGHAVNHGLADNPSQGDSRPALHLTALHLTAHCDLCLMAASLAGSAPAPDLPEFAVQDGHWALLVQQPASMWVPPTLTPCPSRAPTLCSR